MGTRTILTVPDIEWIMDLTNSHIHIQFSMFLSVSRAKQNKTEKNEWMWL